MLRLSRWCLFVLLFWLIGWPLLQLLGGAAQEKGISQSFSQVFSECLSPTTLRTAALAFCVACFSSVVGISAGWLLAFRPPPFDSLVNFGLIAPLVLPSYVLGISWTYVMGGWIYSFVGCVFVLTSCWFPLVALLVRRALGDLDREIRASAMIEGAGTWQLFRLIDLPLVAPVLATGFLLVFIFTLVEFGVPSLLLVKVSSFEVFVNYSALYDPSAAAL